MLPIDFSERFESELALFYKGRNSVLHEAILYSLLGPGKRLRPKLALMSALSLGRGGFAETWDHVLPAMKAVEMIHCYSLVHDDLPAMDNDDYRRGRLSCHKKFGEAIGILVGDALIADAFEVLSFSQQGALAQMRELAQAIGSLGMVLGQEADLRSHPPEASWEYWREIHKLKTGRLFECACVMGAQSVGTSEDAIDNIRAYARAFGLAFQLKDDLSDNSATVSLLGRAKIEELLRENVELALQQSLVLGSEALGLAAQELLEYKG